MVVPTRNQQKKLGKPIESKLTLILSIAIRSASRKSFVQFRSPIEKFNNIASDNSMCMTDMELFVPIASVLVNALKRDQVPASF